MEELVTPGSLWRHRNGNVYRVLHLALVQDSARRDRDGGVAVVYVADTEVNTLVFSRDYSEFTDGRFTSVQHPPTSSP